MTRSAPTGHPAVRAKRHSSLRRVSKYEQVTPAARAIIVFDETREPPVLTDTAAWMEAIDVTDGVYGEVAWAQDAEVLRIEVQEVHRADERGGVHS